MHLYISRSVCELRNSVRPYVLSAATSVQHSCEAAIHVEVASIITLLLIQRGRLSPFSSL